MAVTASRFSSDNGRLERLTSVQPGKHRVVSCYLKLEPRDRSRGKYLIKVKNRVKQTVQGLSRLGLDREAQDAVRSDLERMQDERRVVTRAPLRRVLLGRPLEHGPQRRPRDHERRGIYAS